MINHQMSNKFEMICKFGFGALYSVDSNQCLIAISRSYGIGFQNQVRIVPRDRDAWTERDMYKGFDPNLLRKYTKVP